MKFKIVKCLPEEHMEMEAVSQFANKNLASHLGASLLWDVVASCFLLALSTCCVQAANIFAQKSSVSIKYHFKNSNTVRKTTRY